jgi:hypothetical protein
VLCVDEHPREPDKGKKRRKKNSMPQRRDIRKRRETHTYSQPRVCVCVLQHKYTQHAYNTNT